MSHGEAMVFRTFEEFEAAYPNNTYCNDDYMRRWRLKFWKAHVEKRGDTPLVMRCYHINDPEVRFPYGRIKEKKEKVDFNDGWEDG